MLWWFLILGFSAVVVVLVSITLFIRVRRQMKKSTTHRAEHRADLNAADRDVHAGPAWPPEA
jgi:preprotein translocase subunit YajC